MKRNKREKGNAILEFALVAPLLFPLMLVIFDFGLYAYAYIGVQNAARVAALRNAGGMESASDQTTACSMATDELRGLPNIGSSFSTSCGDAPLVVTSSLCSGTDSCGGFTGTPDGQQAAAVSVTYTVPGVFRFPIVGPSRITRAAEMKLRSAQ